MLFEAVLLKEELQNALLCMWPRRRPGRRGRRTPRAARLRAPVSGARRCRGGPMGKTERCSPALSPASEQQANEHGQHAQHHRAGQGHMPLPTAQHEAEVTRQLAQPHLAQPAVQAVEDQAGQHKDDQPTHGGSPERLAMFITACANGRPPQSPAAPAPRHGPRREP